jgi:hypothetical protein
MSRPPLTVIPTIDNHNERRSGPIKEQPKKRRHVTFDDAGIPSYPVPFDHLALLLADKHEARPSTIKMSEYGETVELNSASGWDKFSLYLFGVEFVKTEHTKLETLIKDATYYDPATHHRPDFANRNVYF